MSSIMLALKGEPNLWHVRAFRELNWLKKDRPEKPPAPEVTIGSTIHLDPSSEVVTTTTENTLASAAPQPNPVDNGSEGSPEGVRTR